MKVTVISELMKGAYVIIKWRGALCQLTVFSIFTVFAWYLNKK